VTERQKEKRIPIEKGKEKRRHKMGEPKKDRAIGRQAERQTN
jgi:hypothetical protein